MKKVFTTILITIAAFVAIAIVAVVGTIATLVLPTILFGQWWTYMNTEEMEVLIIISMMSIAIPVVVVGAILGPVLEGKEWILHIHRGE